MAPVGLTAALPTVLVALGLGAARAVPIAWLVPVWGGPNLSIAPRLGIGFLLATLGWPYLLPAAAAPALAQLGVLGWLLVIGREVLIGAAVGLVAAFAFRAAEAAGGLIDVARGAHAPAGDGAPSAMLGAPSSPLGTLYLLVAAVIFLELGGLGRLAAALARSYQAVPIAGGATDGRAAATAAGMSRAVELIVVASARLVESAIGLAAPVIVALLLADLATAAVARLTPAVPIHFAVMPLRALLGVGVVLLGLGALDAALAAGATGWLGLAERGFTVFR